MNAIFDFFRKKVAEMRAEYAALTAPQIPQSQKLCGKRRNSEADNLSTLAAKARSGGNCGEEVAA
jgi:hypothetical protein